jgi:AhpD family alkylhydroperoxidase
LTVRQFNGCNYCTAAHSMIADKMSDVPKDVLQAIRTGQPIADAKLAALAAMSLEMVAKHGQPSAAAVKVMSNYGNQAFGTPLDPQFAAYKVD